MPRNSRNPRRRDSVADNALQGAENIVHERLRRALQAASLRKIESYPDLHALVSNFPPDLLRDLGAGVEGALTVTEETVPNKFLRGLITAAVGTVGGVTEGAADAAEIKPENVDPEKVRTGLLDFISRRVSATPANPDTVGNSPYDRFFVHKTTPGLFHRVRYSGAEKHWNCKDVDNNYGLHQASSVNLPRGAHLPDFSNDDNYITQQDMVHRSERPCPECLLEMYVKGGWKVPEKKKEEEPEKPKTFEDTLSKKERWVFGRLCDRAMAEGGLASQLVQQAFEKDVWSKVRLLKDILKEGELNKEPSDKLYQRFVRRVDAVFNPRFADRLNSWLTAGTTKVSHWVSEGNWGAVGVVVLFLIAVIAIVIGVGGLLYLSLTCGAAWLFFVDGWYHGRFTEWMVGSVLLAISFFLLVPLQGFVDWVGNQIKAVRRLFVKKAEEIPVPATTVTTTATPTTPVPWIKNLGFSGVFFSLFWGAIGMITVGTACGVKARVMLIIAAMLATAGVVGYAQINKMDVWKEKYLRTLMWVGLLPTFLLVAAFKTTTEWNWEPMQAQAVAGKVNQYVVVNPNPYDQNDDGEYRLEEVFGTAASKYGMVWVEKNQVYSKVRLVADLPGGIEVRPREDGFGRYIYDLKPDRFPERLDQVKTRFERMRQLLTVVKSEKAKTASLLAPPTPPATDASKAPAAEPPTPAPPASKPTPKSTTTSSTRVVVAERPIDCSRVGDPVNLRNCLAAKARQRR